MCRFARQRRLCIHDKFTITGTKLCPQFLAGEDGRLESATCGACPAPTNKRPPKDYLRLRDLDTFCDAPNCLIETFDAYSQLAERAENRYQDWGVDYYITDPVHLLDESLDNYRQELFLAYGYPAERKDITLEAVPAICNLRRSSPYFYPFEETHEDLEKLEQLDLTRQNPEAQAIMRRMRGNLDELRRTMSDLEEATLLFQEARKAAEFQGCQPFDCRANFDAAVSWVCTLPDTQQMFFFEGRSLSHCCKEVFQTTPMFEIIAELSFEIDYLSVAIRRH